MENLPPEIIVEILSRVPAKSVGKCRCVSKPWSSLLCEPQFIKVHLNQTQKQLMFTEEESLLLLSCDFRSLHSTQLKNAHLMSDSITVVGTNLIFAKRMFSRGYIYGASCCNGLIIGATMKQSFFGFFLINPATKQIKKLPSIANNPPKPWVVLWFGIGYDSVIDDYKVVVVYDNKDKLDCTESDETNVNVYSVRNGTWKTAESLHKYRVRVHTHSGIYVDGYIHWVAKKCLDSTYVILAFDLHEERFCEVPLPSSLTDHLDHAMVGGCLGVRSYVKSVAVEFWKMEEYGVKDSWTKFSIISPNDEPMVPECFVGEQKVLLNKWPHLYSLDHEVVMYDLDDKTLKKIVVHGVKDGFHVQGTFVESLVSPHRGNG